MSKKQHYLICVIIAVAALLIGCNERKEITDISQLNDSRYTIGYAEGQSAYYSLVKTMPNAKLLSFTDLISSYEAVKQGKVDGFAYERLQMQLALNEGLTGVRLLDDNIDEPIDVAVGLSPVSKISNLESKINNFIDWLSENGTLDDMTERWFVKCVGEMPEIQSAENPSFTLTVGTSGVVRPFSYYKGTKLCGFDIELAKRFALWLGADLRFKIYDYGAIIAAAVSGDVDLIMSNLNVTAERKEKINFSKPYNKIENTIMVRDIPDETKNKSQNKHTRLKSVAQLKSGHWDIGYAEGQPSSYFALVKNYPNVKLHSYNELFGGYESVKVGRLDGFAYDRLQMQMAIDDGFKGVRLLDDDISDPIDVAVGISPKTQIPDLESKLNTFIRQIKSDGTYNAIRKRWFNGDKTMPDIPAAKSPKLHFVVGTTGIVPPYSYYEGTTLVGIDIEIARRFAAWLGAGVKFNVYDYGSIIVAATAGEIDCIMANLNVSDERRERIGFSEPLYSVANTIMVRDNDDEPKNVQGKSGSADIFTQLNNKDVIIGMGTGINFESICRKAFPEATIQFYETHTDMAELVKRDKLTAFAVDSPAANLLCHEITGIKQVERPLETVDYAAAFSKTADGEMLRNEFNGFLKEITKDGTLAALQKIWFGFDEGKKTIDIPPKTGKNGVINLAMDVTNPPFTYMAGNQPVGYDVAVVSEFCRRRDYGLNITSVAFASLIPGLISERYNCAVGGMCVTEERKQSVNFSEPTYKGATVLIVKDDKSENNQTAQSNNIAGKSDKKNKNKRPKEITSAAQLNNKNIKIGIMTGANFDNDVKKHFPKAQRLYYNNFVDMTAMVANGKLDAMITGSIGARMMMKHIPDITYLPDSLHDVDCSVGFPKNERGEKLCAQMDEFLAKATADGRLDKWLNKWLGSDESVKTVDYDNLNSPNGVVSLVTIDTNEPFEYIKDNKIVGYEIECVTEFCKEFGYGLNVTAVNFDSLLAALSAGTYDCGASMLLPLDERRESLYFSIPNVRDKVVAVVRKSNDNKPTENVKKGFTSLKDFNRSGIRIGLSSGSTFDIIADEHYPKAEKLYFNTFGDIVKALQDGLIDMSMFDEPVAIDMCRQTDNLTYISDYIETTDFAFCFAKDEKSDKLLKEFNAFYRNIQKEGVTQKLREKWLGDDESAQTINPPAYKPNRPTIRLVTHSSYPPFTYIKDNMLVGHDIELTYLFCEAMNYNLDVKFYEPSAVLPVLISGRGDLLCGGISITEERKQSINFSVPTFKAGVVAVVRKPENTDGEHLRYSSIEELNKKGIKIGMGTGMSFETLCRQRVPKASILYFNTFTDMANSIKKGKIDAAILDKPSADMLIANVGGVGCFPELFAAEDYAVIFPKTAKGAALRDEFNAFINKIKDDGRLAEMQKIWMGNDESLMTLPVLPKTGKRGTLRLAVDPVSVPFSYIKKGQPVGYDIAYITAFCQENGYGLDISTMDFTAIIPAITTSGYDFAATGISVTPERKESLYFSEATYNGGAAVLVKKEINKAVKESSDAKNNFFSSLAASFEKTFIRESRWKLILSGIGVTVLISILSAILGTVMGFLICIMRRSNYKILDIIAIAYIRIMQGTPTVVLLMILFYIVFAKTGLNGVMVAIIGFGMNFAAYTSEMMRTGIEAVDKGQTEAALALGYTKVRAFFKVVFPQAAQHFLPVFQGEFISLVKMTSVVGYIAIQDLTKAGDIIRSRTYEAFFPLITIAVIYFVIAWLLTRVLVAVQNSVDPKKRKKG